MKYFVRKKFMIFSPRCDYVIIIAIINIVIHSHFYFR